MAFVVTDYGLIYNDDGSLCVTIRENDVPFVGVKSFAVERETENLFVINGWSTEGEKITDMSLLPSQPPVKPVIASHVPGGANWQDFVNLDGTFTLSDGQSLTMSGWFYVKGSYGEFNAQISVDGTNTGLGIKHITNSGWNYLTWTYTNNTGADVTIIDARIENMQPSNWDNNDNEAWGCNYQLELKPFATSFVDGTRQKGKFYIPLEKIPFDIVNDDWIVAYWKKPIATHNNTLTGINQMCFGVWTGDESEGNIYWGKNVNSNYFILGALYDDGTWTSNSAALYPETYFGNWHFEVVRKNDNVIDYFVDGVLQCSITLSKPLKTFKKGLSVGGNYDVPATNTLIANLAFGFAKDKNSNLIWTDDYIRKVYESRKPFSE